MRATLAILLALSALGMVACGGGDESDARGFGDKAKPLGSQNAPDPGPKVAATTTDTGSGTDAETDTAATTDPAEPTPVEGGDGNDKKIEISSSDFPSGTWPLTIESGELRCVDTRTARTIIFSSGGKDYPVNAVPQGGRIIGIEPIWKKKDDPQSPGTRMDITPLFKKGYELCGD